MTVLELAQKYRASFEIEELAESASYNKRVSLVFDSLFQVRIHSEREEIISACKSRPADIILIEKMIDA